MLQAIHPLHGLTRRAKSDPLDERHGAGDADVRGQHFSHEADVHRHSLTRSARRGRVGIRAAAAAEGSECRGLSAGAVRCAHGGAGRSALRTADLPNAAADRRGDRHPNLQKPLRAVRLRACVYVSVRVCVCAAAVCGCHARAGTDERTCMRHLRPNVFLIVRHHAAHRVHAQPVEPHGQAERAEHPHHLPYSAVLPCGQPYCA